MSTKRPTVVHAIVDTRTFKVAVAFSGMSHAQLALKAGVSKATIGNLASGKRTSCKWETAVKICAALDLKAIKLTPSDLLEVKVYKHAASAAA